jgi:hypothetical protein
VCLRSGNARLPEASQPFNGSPHNSAGRNGISQNETRCSFRANLLHRHETFRRVSVCRSALEYLGCARIPVREVCAVLWNTSHLRRSVRTQRKRFYWGPGRVLECGGICRCQRNAWIHTLVSVPGHAQSGAFPQPIRLPDGVGVRRVSRFTTGRWGVRGAAASRRESDLRPARAARQLPTTEISSRTFRARSFCNTRERCFVTVGKPIVSAAAISLLFLPSSRS